MTTPRKRRRADVPAVLDDGLLLSVADLAVLLRTTPQQVHNLKARGQIPAPTKLPGLGLRWSRAVITAWLAKVVACC